MCVDLVLCLWLPLKHRLRQRNNQWCSNTRPSCSLLPRSKKKVLEPRKPRRRCQLRSQPQKQQKIRMLQYTTLILHTTSGALANSAIESPCASPCQSPWPASRSPARANQLNGRKWVRWGGVGWWKCGRDDLSERVFGQMNIPKTQFGAVSQWTHPPLSPPKKNASWVRPRLHLQLEHKLINAAIDYTSVVGPTNNRVAEPRLLHQ